VTSIVIGTGPHANKWRITSQPHIEELSGKSLGPHTNRFGRQLLLEFCPSARIAGRRARPTKPMEMRKPARMATRSSGPDQARRSLRAPLTRTRPRESLGLRPSNFSSSSSSSAWNRGIRAHLPFLSSPRLGSRLRRQYNHTHPTGGTKFALATYNCSNDCSSDYFGR
jgi:hypothetical protein